MKSDLLLAPFQTWCKASGISTPLVLSNDPQTGYRSLVLPPTKDELFQQSSNSGLVNIIQAPLEACIVGDDWETLVERLVYEKEQGDQSTFAPWLQLFPTLDDFSGMPRFWNEDRLNLVRQYDGGQLESRMAVDQLRFDQVKKDQAWALACVDSRSNFLPDQTYSMTPMLDMLNHKAGVETSARVDGASRLLLEVSKESFDNTNRPSDNNKKGGAGWQDQLAGMFESISSVGSGGYKSGQEVFVSYGNFDNLETLCNYGFIDENNSANVESIRVRLMGNRPMTIAVDSKGAIDNIFNTMALTDLRMALASPEEREELKKNVEGSEWDGMSKISDGNEVETFALIAGELEEALYDAKAGVETASALNDHIVTSYFRGRQNTLEKGRAWLMNKFPELF